MSIEIINTFLVIGFIVLAIVVSGLPGWWLAWVFLFGDEEKEGG